MGVLRVLSHHGDDRLAWDQRAAVAGDPEAVAAVKEAERIFEEQRQRGATAVKVGADRPAEAHRQVRSGGRANSDDSACGGRLIRRQTL